ncbi:MAG: hypothetical protein HYY30_10395 [Chloroflexi bacterium]|nr:hypothetical protein [Chloroflexota bacterium]
MMDEQTVKEYTPTQMLFLRRLEHLLEMRERLEGSRRVSWPNKLVPLAIHSTLLDCRELGVEGEARLIMESHGAEA